MLSKIVSQIKPSATLSISESAKQRQKMGDKILNLSAGEPDINAPDSIKDAAIASIIANNTRYQPVAGIAILQDAIIDSLYKDLGIKYNRNQILVTNGVKQAIFNAFLATINYEDEVIIIAPYWSSYPDMVRIAGGVVRVCNSAKDYSLDIEEIEKNINSKTKWIVINSPNNPTGKIYNKDNFLNFIELMKKYPDILIVSDEIYNKIVYDSFDFLSILHVDDSFCERVLVVRGMSKNYAIPGWRVGYAAGPDKLIFGMKSVQSYTTSGVCGIVQDAAVVALVKDHLSMLDYVKLLEKRKNIVLEKLSDIPGIRCSNPGGAFYVFVSLVELLEKSNKFNNEHEFLHNLLENYGLVCVPGSVFGYNNYLRLSYAVSTNELIEACDLFVDACRNI